MNKVMIVDDNEDIASILEELLNLHGCVTHKVCDSRDALVCAMAFQPDVIFLDLDMPVINGFQVAKFIRSNNLPKQPYIVAYTSQSNVGVINACRDSGFDNYLSKSSDYQAILTTVRQKPTFGNSPSK